jgi:hypothetical protein
MRHAYEGTKVTKENKTKKISKAGVALKDKAPVELCHLRESLCISSTKVKQII